MQDSRRLPNDESLLKYPADPQGRVARFGAALALQRKECIKAVSDTAGTLDWLSRIDMLLQYAGALLGVLEGPGGPEGEEGSVLAVDLVVTLLSAASYYQDISLDTMERAYGTVAATSMWLTSGSYLKKGVGLLEYVLQPSSRFTESVPDGLRLRVFNAIQEGMLEFQLLQQIGIVVLSLSKLRSRAYKDRKDAILDIQEDDLRELSSSSLTYAKLVIGCLDTSSRLETSSESIINKPVIAYLNSLAFLLLSLDQYSKNECGVAIGMIEMCVSYLQQIVPKSQLNDSVLSERRKKTDILKNAFHKSKSKPGALISKGGFAVWPPKKAKKNQLLPLLQETLDDFLVQLAILLRYRYIQTNEKLSFEPVEKSEAVLRKKFPRGKAPELEGSEWMYNHESMEFQEVSTVTNISTATYSGAKQAF